MKTLHDIKAPGLAFTAGIIPATLLPPQAAFPCALAALPAAALCVIWATRRRNATLLILLAYSFTGAACAAANRCFPAVGPGLSEMFRGALESLRRRIAGLGLGGEGVTELVQALLTGDKSTLPAQLKENFRAAGGAHILALSGLHMGIICTLMSRVLFWTGNSIPGRRIRGGLTIAGSGAYCLLTGASPSVVRAFIYITLNELGKLSPGRKRVPLNTFFAALTLQLCFNPGVVRSAAFQLSYLAMLGIHLLHPVLRQWLPASEGRLASRIWNAASLSISCQLFTAPVVWLHFRSFPVNFLITNLLALPVSELFISGSALCLLLDSLHLCPGILKSLTSYTGQALIFCIDVIASL